MYRFLKSSCFLLIVFYAIQIIPSTNQETINYELLKAIKNFDLDKVTKLLEQKADPNFTNLTFLPNIPEGTPLFTTLNLEPCNTDQKTIREQIIVELLQNGANPFPKKESTFSERYQFRDPMYANVFFNLFALRNLIKDPELAAFLVNAGQKYAKQEHKADYLKSFLWKNFNNDANNAIIQIPFPHMIGNNLMAGANINTNGFNSVATSILDNQSNLDNDTKLTMLKFLKKMKF